MHPHSESANNPLHRLVMLHVLSTLLLPVWLVHTVIRSLRDGGFSYLRERLGSVSMETDDNGLHLWIHCASVGEVNTVIPLLKQLGQDLDTIRFTVTTFTPTGKQIFEDAAIANSRHCYLPIDHAWTVTRFLKRVKPDYGLIVETEIWPCLYRVCSRQQIPLSLINARISPKTLRLTEGVASKTILPLLADAVSTLSMVIARSATDQAAIQKLLSGNASTNTTGFTPPPIKIAGNLKNDLSLSTDSKKTDETAPPLSRDYCLLASTHEDEEYRLCKEWMTRNRKELLVIVPRHPERGEKLATSLGTLCNNIVLRSQQPDNQYNNTVTVDPETRIYIADTLGELQRFYRFTGVTFTGGSLVPVGGHNVLEPARSRCAIVSGPHTYNFDAEISVLREAEALMVANDAATAVDALITLLDDDQKREHMINNARDISRTYNVIPVYKELLLADLIKHNITITALNV